MPNTTLTLTPDTLRKLIHLGIIHQRPKDGFHQIQQIPMPFKTVFPELPFKKNRIPEYYEFRYYIEYLGFTPLESHSIWDNYHKRNPTGLTNPFTLLIEAKNHIKRCSDVEPPVLSSRCKALQIIDGSLGQFLICERFGLTRDIIKDVDLLLKKTKEDNKEMDRYLDCPITAQNVEDLLVVDFMIEILDRRFTKLITLERDARAFLEGL